MNDYVKLKVVKILAYGSYKRFMYVKLDGVVNPPIVCVRINQQCYDDLKSLGVPTCQSLRGHKQYETV